ncbi:MAG: hypothetical protein KJO04_06680 [Bacteroidia bacterium]|nr:hypothetical protein [Bacteroidia bacterium]
MLPKNIKIKLLVKAKKIFDEDDPSRDFILNNCALELEDGSIISGKNSDDNFLIKENVIDVFANKKVRWEGEDVGNEGFSPSTREWDYDVSIDVIIFQYEGDNYFDAIVLPGTGGRHGKVTYKTKKAADLPGEPDDYWYTIVFTIFDENGNSKTFAIDPKLKIYK